MIDGAAALAEIGDQVLVALAGGTGAKFLRHQAGQRLLRGDLAQEFDRQQHLLDIMIGGKRIGHDARMGERIGGLDGDLAAARRPAVRQAEGEAGEGIGGEERPLALFRNERREGLHVELHVGPRQIRRGAEEAAAVVDTEAQGAAPHQDIFEPGAELAPPGAQLVVERRHLHAPSVVDALMILQMGADIGVVAGDRDAMLLQQLGRSDAGELQELHRIDGAARHDHLAPRRRRAGGAALSIFNTADTRAVEQEPGHMGMGLDPHIGPLHGRAQEGARRRIAQSTFGGELVVAHTFLGGAVEIGIERQARRLRRFDEIMREGMQFGVIFADAERAAGAAELIGAGLIVLDRLVGLKNFGPIPAGISRRPPVPVIIGMAADIDHGIDRAGAA